MTTVVDFPVKPEARPYVEAFGRIAQAGPEWLTAARRGALARFAEEGFPTRRSESWRYLDLRALEQEPLLPTAAAGAVATAELGDSALNAASYRLVFVDGGFAPALSEITGLPDGVWLGPLAAALRERPALLRRSVEDDQTAGQPFAALNAALFADGFVLDIAPGVTLDRPIEIVHLASGTREASFHTRNVVSLGAESRATILETHAGNGRYWRNEFVALNLAEGAALTRIVVVEEGPEAIHLGAAAAALGAKARLDGFVLLLGGRTVRHEAEICLAGADARVEIDGAFVVAGRDEANIVTTIDHAAPGGETRELIKGVAAGRGHGAFQGRIVVRPDAQKTDARQSSRNLLIGPRAVIDTKPELEIYADDVKCAHGASVGDLDEAALFYLRARGIAEGEARRMLIEGFVREAVETVADAALREHLLRRLARRLADLEETGRSGGIG